MGSKALREWRNGSAAMLDEIEAAQAARGLLRGRRRTMSRLTDAYVVLLSAQFQRFCRDLHSEAYVWALRRRS